MVRGADVEPVTFRSAEPGRGGGTPRADPPEVGILPARRFGGVGLMVEHPGIQVRASPPRPGRPRGRWPSAPAFAHRFTDGRAEGEAVGCCRQRLVVENARGTGTPGLGTGTQLGLAVGQALATTWG